MSFENPYPTDKTSEMPTQMIGSGGAKSSFAAPSGSVCPVSNSVALQVLNRAEVGMKKYGVNAARQDLTTHQWLQHLQEELLDAAVYIERLKQESTLNDRLNCAGENPR